MQRDQEEPQPQLLLTIRQVQKTLKLSRSMVYLLIKRGELRAIHIGKARACQTIRNSPLCTNS